MDPHGVNAMGMQGGMSMPMSMAMPSGGNPQQAMMGMSNGMPMNAAAQYGVPMQQQQQMMMGQMNQMNQMNMGSMAMKMTPNAMNQQAAASGGMQVPSGQTAPGADWRIQLTREHRANLIAKIYNEMVRVSADPVPGIKLWMNVSWYELTLYKESLTQEEYINKIFTRLKSLRAQQTDMNAVMAAQALPNQGMLSRLDFSYYNTLNLNQRAGAPVSNAGQVGGYPGHPQFGGPAGHPGAQQPQAGKPMGMQGVPNGAASTPHKPEAGAPGDVVGEYWRQHAALKSKYHDDVEKVHSAFKKYVDHMKGHDETEQKKKLRYLLSYVQLCASILNEDKSTHPPRKIEELDKVYKYIVKIVNPYLKKLRTETDKRTFTPGADSGNPGVNGTSSSAPTNIAPSSGAPTSSGAAAASANGPGGYNGALNMQQQQHLQPGQQNGAAQNQSLQQKQQQYLMQQRAQQMQQQQQRMQAARQQQMMQQQHMMQQQKGAPNAQPQAHLGAQQTSQMSVGKQQNAQAPNNQQTAQQPAQQNRQHPSPPAQHAQQAPSGQQQSTQSQPPSQLTHPTQQQQQQQKAHAPPQQQQQQQKPQSQAQPQQGSNPQPARENSSLNVGLDDSLYGGMDSGNLLQMPSNLASSGSSSYMGFPNDLSPTNFSGMDLLDMDGSGLTGLTYDGSDGNSGGNNNTSAASGRNSTSGNNSAAGDSSDLGFLEAL